MTAYSTSNKFDICPNCDELKHTLAYGGLGPCDRKMDASEGAP